MSIIKWFNKPKWQSPNEQVRITAIKTVQDVDLINSLSEIVHTDPSLKVQKAALSRIENLQTLTDILRNHGDKSIKKLAGKKLVQSFSQQSDDTQEAIFQQITDPETIKLMAQKAINPGVRKLALQQIKQQGLLSELLFLEPELELQKLIIEKIDQPATLSKLVQKANKKQNDLTLLIQAKLTGHEKQNHDEQAVALCVELENVVHGRVEDMDLAAVKNAWKEIEAHVPKAIQMRFSGAFEAAKMILDPEHRSQFLHKQKQQRALSVLTELEQSVSRQKTFDLQEVQEAISQLRGFDNSDLPDAEQHRYTNLDQQLCQIRDDIQKAQKIPNKVTEILEQITKTLSQQIVQPGLLNQYKKQWSKATRNIKPSEAFSVMEQQFNSDCLKLAEKIEQSAQLRDQAAKDAIALIEPTLVHIKDGHLNQAKEMTNQMAEKKKLAGFSHPILKKNKYQLDSVWNQLKDLRKWQKWSNDKARQDIIDEVKDMVGKALHPDAVMKKLKEVNERWYALEDMEKLPGDKYPSRNQKMWQEFRIVSKALFEPTQPFFEKRSEQQNSYLADIQTSIDQMNQVDLNEASERDLARLSRQAIKHLKSLDSLPPKERGKTAKKLRQGINRIDNKLNEFYQIAEKKKVKLIEQAQELSQTEDIDEAIHSAKQLQQQWKTAGIVKQQTERKLWKKFRQANDAVFNRRDQAKKAINDAQQEQRKAAQSFLNEFKKQLKSATTAQQLNDLKSDYLHGWEALDKPEKLLAAEYSHLLQKIKDAIQADQFKLVIKAYKDKEQLDALYSQLEQQTLTQDAFEKQSKSLLSPEMVSFFSQRSNNDEHPNSLINLLIQGEYITGLETPEQDMDARMAYQVKVLSERMAGEKSMDNHSQASAWLDQWYLLAKPDSKQLKSNSKRINNIIKAMMKLLVE